jgi:hypothetical protein
MKTCDCYTAKLVVGIILPILGTLMSTLFMIFANKIGPMGFVGFSTGVVLVFVGIWMISEYRSEQSRRRRGYITF